MRHVVDVRGWGVVESPTSLTDSLEDGERVRLIHAPQLGILIGIEAELE